MNTKLAKWLLRATTNNGKQFSIKLPEQIAIMAFMNIYETVKSGLFPSHEYLPNVWKTEIFPQFTAPDGIVVKIDICQHLDDQIIVFNTMWFVGDSEGRRQLKTEHEPNIVYTFTGAEKAANGELHGIPVKRQHGDEWAMVFSEFVHGEASKDFHQDEMSSDFHMGHYQEATQLVVNKTRAPGDNSGVFKLEGLGSIHSNKFDGVSSSPNRVIDLAPSGTRKAFVKGSNPDSEWYSAPPMKRTEYRIYINGIASDLILNDIDFMGEIHEHTLNGLFQIPRAFNHQQEVYDMLYNFLKNRNMKIGAHPMNEILEDGNDAEYSLFWDQDQKETLYISPSTFSFDDLSFE